MRSRLRVSLTLSVLVVLAAAVGAQESFEVASIRRNTAGELRVGGGFLPGGHYRVTNYSLRSLIAAAYLRPQVPPDFLIAGGPSWMDADRFDVDARAAAEFPAAPDGPSSPRRAMLQRLLADWFGLRVHVETKETAIYALVMARADRRPGGQLRPASGDCAAAPASCRTTIAPGVVALRGGHVSQFVNLLPRFVNRVVIDRSGLDGTYDADLKWTPAPGEWVAPSAPGAPEAPADGPSLFTALTEQLGLKLEPSRGPVEVRVVDDARLPTDN